MDTINSANQNPLSKTIYNYLETNENSRSPKKDNNRKIISQDGGRGCHKQAIPFLHTLVISIRSIWGIANILNNSETIPLVMDGGSHSKNV